MRSALIAGTLLLAIIATIFFDEVRSLECYVCSRQEGNAEKCLTTTKTCESDENACQSEIRWGSTPYWSQGAEKQYYVTKKCAKKEDCEEYVNRFTSSCQRIWYEDWKCGECCQGDRCNYYIIMGAGNLKATWLLSLVTAVVIFRHIFAS
ncbi:unnamed protein product [Allacma fusca]|uniref:Uncharacterized protein n=1 Tax=Allacma fusca TaxID=39272 RepID=A0A8J2LYW7_9HEXA|nr:unnamed protein product [Allacma fusca]